MTREQMIKLLILHGQRVVIGPGSGHHFIIYADTELPWEAGEWAMVWFEDVLTEVQLLTNAKE